MSEPIEHNNLRASDVDRERVARVLHDAMAEGRLTVSELDERLAALYKSKTFGELAEFTKDLPTQQPTTAVGPIPIPNAPVASSSRRAVVGGISIDNTEFAIMSEVRREGDWVVPTHLSVSAFWGAARLDLREAQFAAQECTIQASAVMGRIDITVPQELTVHVQGSGVMGKFEHTASGQGLAEWPVLRVTGVAICGVVEVTRA